MERKLASVQQITEILPHDNADTLEIAKVLGWNVIVKKGGFKPGDLCVFFEVDSILPEKPEFEFMRNKHFKVKTIRLRGKISQGLCLPMDILVHPECTPTTFNVGDDVSAILDIRKKEDPAVMNTEAKGLRPHFVPKTDEIRIQSVPEFLDRHKGIAMYITEKMDGTSVSYYFRDGEFGVCSRNLEVKENDANIYWKMAKDNDVQNKMKQYNYNVVIQGEIIGPGIQKNKYLVDKHYLFMYNVYDLNTCSYFDFEKFVRLMKMLELQTVPILNEHFVLNNTIDELVELSKGTSVCTNMLRPKDGPQLREGIVIRSLTEGFDDEVGRISFKVINPDFLIKHGE